MVTVPTLLVVLRVGEVIGVPIRRTPRELASAALILLAIVIGLAVVGSQIVADRGTGPVPGRASTPVGVITPGCRAFPDRCEMAGGRQGPERTPTGVRS